MKLWRKAKLGVVAAIAGIVLPAAALAQGAAQQPTVTDSRTNGSWSVRCVKTAATFCDMTQVSYVRGRNLRLATIAINYLPKNNSYIGHFIVPLGVSFDAGLGLDVGSFHQAKLRYRRCERDGCVVEGALPATLVAAMQNSNTAKGSMKITFVNGRKIDVPIVLDGFSDSLDLLKQWTNDKANGGDKSSEK